MGAATPQPGAPATGFAGLPEISVRDVVNSLFRHKWKIILFFTAVVSVVTASTFRVQVFYESHAKILIRAGRENIAADPTVVGPTQYLEQKLEDAVNSELAIISSPYVLERVARKIGPFAYFNAEIKPYTRAAHTGDIRADNADELIPVARINLNRDNKLINGEELGFTQDQIAELDRIAIVAGESIGGGLQPGVEVKTYIISLSYKELSPELAKETLDRLIVEAEARHIEVYKALVDADFFERRVRESESRLQLHEKQLKDFMSVQGISDLGEQIRYLIELSNHLAMQLSDANGNVEASDARIKAIQASLKKERERIETSRTRGNTNHTRVEIKRQLFNLRLKEIDLASRYTDEALVLRDVREQIRVAEAALAKEPESETMVSIGLNEIYTRLRNDLLVEQAQYASALARREAMRQDVEDNQAQLTRLSNAAIELSRLKRNVEIATEEYKNYRGKLQYAQISDELDENMASSISVVQPATYPLMPLPNRTKLKIAISIVLGLLGGLALVFVLEIMDDTLKNEEDIKRRLHLPVLASIPYEQYQKRLKRSLEEAEKYDYS